MNQFQLAANEQKINMVSKKKKTQLKKKKKKKETKKKKTQLKKKTPVKKRKKVANENKCQSWITACQYIMLTSILCISVMIIVLVHK